MLAVVAVEQLQVERQVQQQAAVVLVLLLVLVQMGLSILAVVQAVVTQLLLAVQAVQV
jgi:hypothetical protein